MSLSDDKVLNIKQLSKSQGQRKKTPFSSTVRFYEPLNLLIFSLIDGENKIFTLKFNRKTGIQVIEHDNSYFTNFITK